jgi:phosphatidylserine/phosphatidylglycerophosphate/cardiolipin synthase-like enzyme
MDMKRSYPRPSIGASPGETSPVNLAALWPRAGVAVAVDRSPAHMHHKFAVFDRRILLSGSYNWTRGAADSNSENILVTGDPWLVRAYQAEFDGLWQAFAREV